MPRRLTPREEAVLRTMIAQAHDAERTVLDLDRWRWAHQVNRTRAGAPCDCGTCPSIELTDTEGRTPSGGSSRRVLEAAVEGALVQLFVDDDRLGYLELAPVDDDDVFEEFPDPATLVFTTE